MIQPFHSVVARRRITGGGGTEWVTGQTIGSLRADFDGFIGCRFTVGGSTVTVTHLGRYKHSGNTQTHTVNIRQTGGTIVATATVDMSIGSAGTYIYTSITPVVLSASTDYVLQSQETIGGDQWADDSGCTITTTGVASCVASSYQDIGAPTPTDSLVGSGISYGPSSFQYS